MKTQEILNHRHNIRKITKYHKDMYMHDLILNMIFVLHHKTNKFGYINCIRKQLVPLGLLQNTLGDHWDQDLVNLLCHSPCLRAWNCTL